VAVRVGIVILPDQRWSDGQRRWRLAEQYGFAHAWTYDHLGWRSLVDGPWFDAAVTLTAAAGVTERIKLGTMVASPHFRHPVSFARVITGLDDVSSGRFMLGVGSGTRPGAGSYDTTVLGLPAMPAGDHHERFAEFLELLDALLRTDRVTWHGHWYTAVDARNLPGCVQVPRVPFVVAANGPRGRDLAARYGQGWVTSGPATPTENLEQWWRGVGQASERFTEQLAAAGRDPSTVDRYVTVDAAAYSLASVDAFTDAVGRAQQAGFTDVVVHWPRPRGQGGQVTPGDWYVGDEAVLEAVAADVLPGLG
jgi:alkanesulfonate monooxygenase SsuD/methylene tetrahydromethanopterin reductase-like flavin-dependent oxidoreductase (luciferase family)